MNKKLFVGNLPFSVDENQLKDLFTQAGTIVSATVISDKFTGRSRGFGFVEMETEEGAQKAIDTLNGTEMDGRKIIVNEARPMEERPPRDSQGGGFGRRDFGGRGDRGGRY